VPLLGQQEFADPAAELLTAVEPDQPGSGQAGTPLAVDQRGELVVADLARGPVEDLNAITAAAARRRQRSQKLL
jgi:hypothetical protein